MTGCPEHPLRRRVHPIGHLQPQAIRSQSLCTVSYILVRGEYVRDIVAQQVHQQCSQRHQGGTLEDAEPGHSARAGGILSHEEAGDVYCGCDGDGEGQREVEDTRNNDLYLVRVDRHTAHMRNYAVATSRAHASAPSKKPPGSPSTKKRATSEGASKAVLPQPRCCRVGGADVEVGGPKSGTSSSSFISSTSSSSSFSS
eukprot:CAMPEP_0173332314 /NCGR_PEP_ID=MMETSP1144-20121109/4292_1 /TAXON_ID=483371 /ORGANISM="non described non described, Strain CCMP2298" /LENGTH=198 /DNA_ID=CAMNT_0014277201 /DNA_START=325 /DNA_END=919 /DNA_ORIENTATION=-